MKYYPLAALLLATAAPAFAQDPPPPPTDPAPPPPPDPAAAGPSLPPAPGEPTNMPPSVDPAVVNTRTPGIVLPNMLPSRVGGTVDVRVDYTYADSDDLFFNDLFALAFTFYGSYITPGGLGGYAQMPYWYASIGGGDGDSGISENGVGNLELGGLYRIAQSPASELLLRGGVSLDTAGTFGDILGPFTQLAPRLYDAYPTGFATTWGRVEGSFRHSEGNLRLAASVGGDIPITSDDESDIDLASEIDAIGKVAVSVGIDSGGMQLGVGVVMMQAFGVDSDDERIFGANITAAFPVSPTMSLYGAVGIPDLENNFDDQTLLGFGAGLRIAAN